MKFGSYASRQFFKWCQKNARKLCADLTYILSGLSKNWGKFFNCFYSNYNNIKPRLIVLLLTLLLFLLLLLLSIFTLLFYLLVDSRCQKYPPSLYHQLEAVFMDVTMSDFASCFEQARWFLCHLEFPVCKFDKTRKIWRKIPICKSSCLSYRKTPSCKPIMLNIHVYPDLKRYCGNLPFLDSLFCLDQQNVSRTDCLTNLPSKYFNLNILCLKRVGGECSFGIFWNTVKV